jgi:undecaprenyl-diphosphatase
MDQKLLFLINHEWTSPGLDRVMALFSSFAAWTPLIVIAILLALWRGGFRARAFVLTAGLAVGICDGVVSKTLKRVVDRPRPHQVLDGVRVVDLAKATPRLLAVTKPVKVKLSHPTDDLETIEGRAFPSSHTMNMIAVALVAACFYRRWGWLAFFPALLVAYSRIYTGSHWPSDILTSLFLGVGITLLILALVEWIWRRQGDRFLPKVHAAHPSLFAA